MTAQNTANMNDESAEAPPPMAAVAAAHRQQVENAQMQRPPVAETGTSVFLGIVVLGLAALSAVAAWVAS